MSIRSAKQRIHGVPTNIITGFLGAGKTTAIMHLLKQKPTNERWAVLVNEFGEVGVDGSLFESNHRKKQDVFIREVPGGCMCCVAGVPMRVALNLLLDEAKPDRLLIEPTGLGHPIEVLEVLSSSFYQEVLSIQKVITLVDSRKLADKRYTQHATFNQQIAIADIIIGNKKDLYQQEDQTALEAYAKLQGTPGVQVFTTEQGVLEQSWLEGATSAFLSEKQQKTSVFPTKEVKFKDEGLQQTKEKEGFQSIGWRFSPDKVFDRSKLHKFLLGLSVERLKAVVVTNKGVFGYNQTLDGMMEMPLNDCMESRIEIIATEIDSTWENKLSACLLL